MPLHLESCTPGTRQYKVVRTGTYQYILDQPPRRNGGVALELAFRTRLPGKESQPSCRQGPYYKTTTASWAKATRRTSTLTRKASRQSQINTTHRSPAKPSQGPVTPTPSTYDSDQQAPSHGPNITDDSSPTRISEPKCPIVNRLNYWADQGAKHIIAKHD